MGKQYKLFKIFEYDKTKKELIDIFSIDNIWEISNDLIAISYDYEANQYKNIINKTYNLNVSPKIITSRFFIKLIENCIDNEYFLRKIDFIESIPTEDVYFINDNIEKLNVIKNVKEKDIFKKVVIDELNWLKINDGIDIKSISFRIKNIDKLKVGISIYNNGVISVDNASILDDIKELIK